MNRGLGEQIDIRDKMVEEANKNALKTTKNLEEQNKGIAEVLKKLRAPSKFCMDICMVLLLLGLIAVIVMLVKNGK